jgi:hypothetical protein
VILSDPREVDLQDIAAHQRARTLLGESIKLGFRGVAPELGVSTIGLRPGNVPMRPVFHPALEPQQQGNRHHALPEVACDHARWRNGARGPVRLLRRPAPTVRNAGPYHQCECQSTGLRLPASRRVYIDPSRCLGSHPCPCARRLHPFRHVLQDWRRFGPGPPVGGGRSSMRPPS